MTAAQETVKRLIDIVASGVALVFFSPLFAVIAVAILIDSPGEVMFRQKRSGLSGMPFTVFKFRTMFENAPDLRNPDGSTFNSFADARVTRVGHLLRITSLDELPQLINVLVGEMSLVGPRPDMVDQSSYYGADEWRRLKVKPGITGLAQINGRNVISWAARTRLDLQYVDHQSLRLDLKILWRTTGYVLSGRDVFITNARRAFR